MEECLPAALPFLAKSVHQKDDSVDKMTNVKIDLPIVVIYMAADDAKTGFLQVY